MSSPRALPSSFVERLEGAGFARVTPGVLQPAEPFLDVMGEELRQRVFLTSDAQGHELCLRPDFTIPTALIHISRGACDAPGAYFYEGPVFRHGSNGGEAPQAGVESFGRADAIAAETEVLALAIEACGALGLPEPAIRIGDRAVVEAAVDALDAPVAFRRRLKRSLAHGGTLEALSVARAEEAEHAGLFAALAAAGPESGRAVIEDLLSLAGIAAVGGRTAGEIAERFLERAEALSVELPADARRALGALLAVDDLAPEALATLQALSESAGVSTAVATLGERLDTFRKAGLPVERMRFQTRFGRGLDYYTGLVFELSGASGSEPVAGGGRYDGLLTALGAPKRTPGVGFALWLERFPGARP
ncbi:ATP phosphoribosyltransferase regulatory subunit [Hansschlegelia zhihuaiae]|uniref:Class II Histidinyl-tRNA synthetase (HisRS)-like catalytic core domain-containing protein n=1 Tax=Hansschlegelia zhihuaiae TaxID=405005 RepID=A0A4Q0MQT1_9HYPH|nr:ATP phosphoribosyltransferase regulatory subunit [Hansschlegelia zhihuaiae]RXF75496.1 hypothetical protein EK403_01160 [Hansschlegelia zhihuaiae]